MHVNIVSSVTNWYVECFEAAIHTATELKEPHGCEKLFFFSSRLCEKLFLSLNFLTAVRNLFFSSNR